CNSSRATRAGAWALAALVLSGFGCHDAPATSTENREKTPPDAVASAAPSRAAASPTFTRDIAPLVYKHCASCHRPGEAAPFPLLEYADVHERAGQIADVVGR